MAHSSPLRLSASRPLTQHRLCCSTTIRHGFLPKKISSAAACSTRAAAEVIQDRQQGRAAPAGLLGQATELGHAGRLPFLGSRFGHGLGHEHGQEAAADRQADAFGLGGAGKGGKAVVVEEEGVGEELWSSATRRWRASSLVAELLELSLRVVAMKGVQDGLGVAVESLSGESGRWAR